MLCAPIREICKRVLVKTVLNLSDKTGCWLAIFLYVLRKRAVEVERMTRGQQFKNRDLFDERKCELRLSSCVELGEWSFMIIFRRIQNCIVAKTERAYFWIVLCIFVIRKDLISIGVRTGIRAQWCNICRECHWML